MPQILCEHKLFPYKATYEQMGYPGMNCVLGYLILIDMKAREHVQKMAESQNNQVLHTILTNTPVCTFQ